MLKTAQSGKEVNMDELPPQVATGMGFPLLTLCTKLYGFTLFVY